MKSSKKLISNIHSSYSSMSRKNQIKKWAEDLNRYFSEEDLHLAKKHIKRCSTSVTIREMKIKTTTQNGQHQKVYKQWMLNRVWEKGTFLHCWWDCNLVQPLCRTEWKFLKNLKIELPYEPAIPLLGIYMEKTIIWKYTWTPMFIAALITMAKT